MRKIILINLMLLAFASSAQAVDNYNPKTMVLTIPSVMVGDLTYSNVSVKVSLKKALRLAQNPTTGIITTLGDSGIDINLGNTSRGIPSLGDGRVSFSLKVTNKTSARMYIAAAASPNLSTLSDNQGNVCDNYGDDPFNIAPGRTEFLHITGVPYVKKENLDLTNLTTNQGKTINDIGDINNYRVIEAGETRILGVSTFNPAPVDSSFCYFTGNIFTFESYLWLYNADISTPKLISFSFDNIPIPIPKAPKSTSTTSKATTIVTTPKSSATVTTPTPTVYWR
jgi:opacity protein-like surface antigen